MSKILILNGSIRGIHGNSWAICNIAKNYLETEHSKEVTILNLSDYMPSIKEVYNIIDDHDGFIIISGTYWNNFGSPLQRFIEVVTPLENSSHFFGKPVACAVTMDSVGGMDVAARVHSVFSGLGCWSPPCSTLVISRIAHEAVIASNEGNEDVWSLDDIKIVLTNLVVATTIKNKSWVSWSNVNLKLSDGEWPETGDLNLKTPVFIKCNLTK